MDKDKDDFNVSPTIKTKPEEIVEKSPEKPEIAKN